MEHIWKGIEQSIVIYNYNSFTSVSRCTKPTEPHSFRYITSSESCTAGNRVRKVSLLAINYSIALITSGNLPGGPAMFSPGGRPWPLSTRLCACYLPRGPRISGHHRIWRQHRWPCSTDHAEGLRETFGRKWKKKQAHWLESHTSQHSVVWHPHSPGIEILPFGFLCSSTCFLIKRDE